MEMGDAIRDITTSYFFRGEKFLEYFNTKEFVKTVKDNFKIVNEDITDVSKLYRYIFEEKPHLKKEVDELFFEQVLYSNLKNVYVNTFDEEVSIQTLEKRMKQVLTEVNMKNPIPPQYYPSMKESGFNLMEKMYITEPGAKFIVAYDYKETESKLTNCRILFVESIRDKNNKARYFLSGIDINFKEKFYLIMIRNIADSIDKSNNQGNNISNTQEEKIEVDTTTLQLYNRVQKDVVSKIVGNIEEINPSVDRKALYYLCEKLDTALLGDIRKTVNSKIRKHVEQNIESTFSELFKQDIMPGPDEKKELADNMESLLVASYIKAFYGDRPKKIAAKAKGLGLPGYSTKFTFKGNRANKGSTQSSNSKEPVSATDMFHSLYISFKGSMNLENLGISWFEDFNQTNKKNTHVVQTVAYSQANQFRVVFKPRRDLNKELIYHVIRQLNEQRRHQAKKEQRRNL
ncbi:hypothetical protein [Priestia aryabhattai]|uniref:hypothetical protein n=1 Tax=Priestia aryabhattai TaxID=412384 RepID=UPI0032E8BFDB